MTINSMQPAATSSLPRISVSDDMSDPITRSIDNLSQDVGLFTRLRLRQAKGREAVKLSETALTEYMAAKRRTFVYQVGLVEDQTKKLMLTDSMGKTAQVEREMARIISEAVSNFEGLITGHEEAAYRAEIELTRKAEAMFAADKISERRLGQMVANIELSTDKIVETIQTTTREILANLERRFHAALAQT